MCRCCKSFALLPALLAILSISTFILTYTVSLVEDDVSPWFPSISQTGDKVPESNIFSQLFNICSFVFVLTLFVRFLQLRHDSDWNEEARPLLLRLNITSLVFGLLAGLGASLVANFQVDAVTIVHLTGAVMVFLCSVFYCWIQTLITYKMMNCGLNSAGLFVIRSALSGASTVFFILTLVGRGYAQSKWQSGHPNSDLRPTWKPGETGYKSHIMSDAAEWLMAITILVFITTFFGEFRSIKMKLMVSRRSESPVPLSVSEDSMRSPLLL
ncbi:predicted protein [Nematostella vectensis]|uniref:CWH43-like N-terminal domain-containing protein n=1 Tax=Nematostella vectensis TaxID=45351 RepID=A7S3L1_NEMVE|nr:DNA damage-regulated autophagy modulator protein 1 [Nematostella vectensis]EDO41792.1 predicted protein [Nematostella vectensis]|eukprot:XP_001633855.1 predicted protein [Nematostella vectensis]